MIDAQPMDQPITVWDYANALMSGAALLAALIALKFAVKRTHAAERSAGAAERSAAAAERALESGSKPGELSVVLGNHVRARFVQASLHGPLIYPKPQEHSPMIEVQLDLQITNAGRNPGVLESVHLTGDLKNYGPLPFEHLLWSQLEQSKSGQGLTAHAVPPGTTLRYRLNFLAPLAIEPRLAFGLEGGVTLAVLVVTNGGMSTKQWHCAISLGSSAESDWKVKQYPSRLETPWVGYNMDWSDVPQHLPPSQ